jgi:hypothetical protein
LQVGGEDNDGDDSECEDEDNGAKARRLEVEAAAKAAQEAAAGATKLSLHAPRRSANALGAAGAEGGAAPCDGATLQVRHTLGLPRPLP